MDRIAKASAAERRRIFQDTADSLSINTAMVEKDFWVCWTLGRIFADEWLGQVLRFRGGTSLSKGYGLIKRFSEDIDITLDKGLVLTDDKSRALLRSKSSYKEHKQEVSDIAAQYISTILKDKIEGLISDMVKVYTDEEYAKAYPKFHSGRIDNKNLHIVFPKVAEDYAGLLPNILLEVGILSALTPNEPRKFLPYIAEQNNQLGIAPITVATIMAKRTLWDKATILHREHYRPATKRDGRTGTDIPNHTPERYSRHYHDLYQMALSAVKDDALADFELLQEVIDYKNLFYPCGWGQTFDACAEGHLRLLPNENNHDLLIEDYEKNTKRMIFGDIPKWNDILSVLQELENEINKKGGKHGV